MSAFTDFQTAQRLVLYHQPITGLAHLEEIVERNQIASSSDSFRPGELPALRDLCRAMREYSQMRALFLSARIEGT